MEKKRLSKDLPEFEVLVKMAKEDPEGLEALRLKLVKSLIDEAPEDQQRRLKGLQFKIDMEREKAKNPMAACVKISQMMHDSFTVLRDALKDAQENHIKQLRQISLKSTPAVVAPVSEKSTTANRVKKVERKANPSATILEFPPLST